ncbi:uncharacterized protein ARMOST_02746 [Armillaria ostoyae]|uniref:Uncharacterized protein n=1 Tax=Armillaria ostoyae TaxID=47428 RepID=A0A284QSK3_ARMOS|nr:uncharacterized protein ARMOST_02746 [Armillaria ostoyae]
MSSIHSPELSLMQLKQFDVSPPRQCNLKEEFGLVALLFSMFQWDIVLRSILRHRLLAVEDVRQTCHRSLLPVIVVQIKSALRDASAALEPSYRLVLSLETPPCSGGSKIFASAPFLNHDYQSVPSACMLLIALSEYDWLG